MANEQRVIVKLLEAAPSEELLQEQAASIAAEWPGAVVVRVNRSRAVLMIAESDDFGEVKAKLEQRPDVAYVDPDVIDTAQQGP